MVLIPFVNEKAAQAAAMSPVRIASEPVSPRIAYLLALPDERSGRSVFQGFDPALLNLSWAFETMVELPATIFEGAAPLPPLIAMRACGMAAWRHRVIPASWVKFVPMATSAPFTVVFTADPAAAQAISRHFHGRADTPLHISTEDVPGAIAPENADVAALKKHFIAFIDANPKFDLKSERIVIARWKRRPKRRSAFAFKGNYTLLPNQMALRSAGIEPRKEIPDWSSNEPQDYTDAIMESARAVDEERSRGRIDDTIRLVPPRPDTWLIAPALLPDFKRNIELDGMSRDDRRAAKAMMRMYERQRDFGVPLTREQHDLLMESEPAKAMKATRNLETRIFAAAIGLATAGTMASAYRLTPAIMQAAGKVRVFAENVRAEANTPASKVAKLFSDVQDQLGAGVPQEIIDRVEKSTWGVKAVTDAPIEWLPVRGLPLTLLRDVSRIPATPGDLTIELLSRHEPIRIPVEDFADVLVVSAFEEGDSFDRIRAALDITEANWSAQVRIKFVRVGTQAEFVAAINNFEGPLMIFDGHGTHERNGQGKLLLGKEEIDVWQLPSAVRVPPIVILSACDTHAADRHWSSVSNAFLHLGARTVLATLLPVGVTEGAVFIARLIFRLAGFLPIAAAANGRITRWSEVVGGMLRMQLVTDLLRPLLSAETIAQDRYDALHARASFHAHYSGAGAIGYLEQELSDLVDFSNHLRSTVASSDTIRYAQMGSPETILIGSVDDLPAAVRTKLPFPASFMAPVWREERTLDIAAVRRAEANVRRLLSQTRSA